MKTQTPSQERATLSTSARTVVIAGPGSGKTATLVERYLRHQEGKNAIITFTANAAKELVSRIESRGGVKPWFCGTLHAFALRLVCLEKPVAVLDEETADALLLQVRDELRCKESMKSLRECISKNAYKTGLAATVGERYVRTLAQNGCTDYDRLLIDALDLLQRVPLELNHLYIDEFQDASEADYAIYEAIHARHRFYVGDPDQAIFRFRGGDNAILLREAERYPDDVVLLEDNFRSTYEVCQAAQRLIERNVERVNKATKTRVFHSGSVEQLTFPTETEEMAFLIGHVRKILPEETLGVLVRYGECRTRVTDSLVAAGVIERPQKEKDPHDWRLTLLTLQLMEAPGNELLAFRWLSEKFGESVAIERRKECRHERYPLRVLLEGSTIQQTLMNAGVGRESMSRVLNAMESAMLTGSFTPAQLVVALRELFHTEEKAQRIRVMTLHGSKGLEFDHVVLPYFEDGLIPGTAGRVRGDCEEERRLAYVGLTRARSTVVITNGRMRRGLWKPGFESTVPSRFADEIL